MHPTVLRTESYGCRLLPRVASLGRRVGPLLRTAPLVDRGPHDCPLRIPPARAPAGRKQGPWTFPKTTRAGPAPPSSRITRSAVVGVRVPEVELAPPIPSSPARARVTPRKSSNPVTAEMRHPALIARYVEDLLTTLDTDVPKTRAILMRVLPAIHPHARRRQLQNLRGPRPFGCRRPRSL